MKTPFKFDNLQSQDFVKIKQHHSHQTHMDLMSGSKIAYILTTDVVRSANAAIDRMTWLSESVYFHP